MAIVLHSLELDADRQYCTLCIQLGEAETTTCRVRIESKDDGTHFNSNDGSFERLTQRLTAMAEKENLRSSAYLFELLVRILDQKEGGYGQPLIFPILIDANRLRLHKSSLWKGIRTRLARNLSLRWPLSSRTSPPFPPSNPKL